MKEYYLEASAGETMTIAPGSPINGGDHTRRAASSDGDRSNVVASRTESQRSGRRKAASLRLRAVKCQDS